MKREQLKIEGMSCAHCVMAVKKELTKLDMNLIDVKIGSAEIEFDENKISDGDLSSAIEEAGFKLVERVKN